MEEKMKKLRSLMEADEVFAKELYMKETAEEAQVLLKEKGLEFTLEELKQVYEATLKALEAQAAGKELSESELEEVAGGFGFTNQMLMPITQVTIGGQPTVKPGKGGW
ncbi:hypothetical protein [Anoxynatronum sibiricum]|uniref:Nif11 domain-containing protein n=1 Tax=Anoxynatronum sibiricum TaxID=210623 RepID=A0ABU9VW50_9CLOT